MQCKNAVQKCSEKTQWKTKCKTQYKNAVQNAVQKRSAKTHNKVGRANVALAGSALTLVRMTESLIR
jgi:hypothetical protein